MQIKIISIILILSLVLTLSGCILKFNPNPSEGPGSGDVGGVEDGGGEGGEDEGEPEPGEPIIPTEDGYTFPTTEDTEIHKASDVYEASAIIDRAIMDHVSKLTIDFSDFGEEYNPLVEFQNECEFSSHIRLRYTQNAETPKQLTVTITYRTAAASKAMPSAEAYAYDQITSANDLASYLAGAEKRRGDDFVAFPIDLSARESIDVYNSEELWWAIEHGYKPTFPIENSSAERIYNNARAVLKEIISDDMDDFEKSLAIYEYLVREVDYDYDSYYDSVTIVPQENTCYYLEGVFDYGKAVCDGKSKAFVLLCGIEEISAVRDFGFGVNADTGHAWNYVKVDGVWYTVDTTNGDVAKGLADSGIAEFYGKNVQVINYKLFLTNLSLYEGKYVYSGVWQSITSTDRGQTRTADVLSKRDPSFKIDSVNELTDILDAVIKNGETEFVLVIGFTWKITLRYGENAHYRLMDEALALIGAENKYEYLIWNESIDSSKNYMYTFKVKGVQ